MSGATGDLHGRGVLVTRPREQAEPLRRELASRGARVVLLPTVAIEGIDTPELRARARDLAPRAHWLVFVSPNAAECGGALLIAAGVPPAHGACVAAVGRGTAKALAGAGIPVDAVPPEGGGGEALLERLAAEDVTGRRVLIVRGVGGREVLAEGLRRRGAKVAYLEVYRRMLPEVDTAAVAAGWRDGTLRFTIVTSGTGLEHLLALFGPADRARLLDTRLITVSERIAGLAREAGFRHRPVVAAGTDCAALADAVAGAASEEDSETPST